MICKLNYGFSWRHITFFPTLSYKIVHGPPFQHGINGYMKCSGDFCQVKISQVNMLDLLYGDIQMQNSGAGIWKNELETELTFSLE